MKKQPLPPLPQVLPGEARANYESYQLDIVNALSDLLFFIQDTNPDMLRRFNDLQSRLFAFDAKLEYLKTTFSNMAVFAFEVQREYSIALQNQLSGKDDSQ